MKRIILTTFWSFVAISSFGQVTVQDINVSLDSFGFASINTSDVLTGSLPSGTTATLSKSNFSCSDLAPPSQAITLSLDNTNDYAVVSHTPDLNLDGSWTLEGWMYRYTKNPGGDVILDKWSGSSFFDEYGIFIFNDIFYAEVTTTTGNFAVAATGITPALNQWYHVAGSLDRATGTLKIYIDGVLRGTTTGITGASLNTNNNTILGGIDWGNASIDGLIDDVRIWQRVLSDTDIAQFYNQPLRGDELGLVANWKFEELFGNTTYSSSSQAYPAVYQENGVVSLISWSGNPAVTVGNNLNRIYLTATDSGGTSTNYPFVVTVEDAIPQAIIQDISVNLDSSGNATITAQDIDIGSTANCSGIASLSIDRTNLDCNDIITGSRGIRVNGVDQHVAIPASSANRITGNYTLSAWVKYDDTGIDRQYAVSIPSGFNGTGNSIYINKVNRFVSMTFIDGNTGAPSGLSTGPNVIMPNTWTHIAVSYDGVNAKIFVNGVLSASQARTLLFPTSSQPIYLGVEGDGSIIGQRRFKGEIDEVRLWNFARTEKEIRDDMNFDISPQTTGLRALYRLDEASGTSIIDEVNGAVNSVFSNMNPATDRIDSDRVRGVPVTLTVTTNDGETDSSVAMVTVNDTSSAQVVTQDISVNLVNGSATIAAQDIDNGSTAGACYSITSLTLDRTTFTCADIATPVTVTLSMLDDAGVTTTGTAQVTAIDSTLPTAVANNITVSLDNTGNATIDLGQINGGSTAGCSGIASLALTPSTFDCTNLGTNSVTLTVTDGNGNIDTTTAMVTVGLPVGLSSFQLNSLATVNDPNITGLTTGDINNDGLLDLFITTSTTGNIRIFLQQNDGSYVLESTVLNSVGFTSFNNPQLLDFDGDGILDLLLDGYDNSQAYPAQELFIRDNATATYTSIWSSVGSIVVSQIFDIDGNGQDDIFHHNGGNNNPSVMRPPIDIQLKNGSTVEETAFTYAYASSVLNILQTLDIDDDGDVDLILKRANLNVADLYINQGNSNFQVDPSFNLLSFYATAVGDYNGDGIIEAVTPIPPYFGSSLPLHLKYSLYDGTGVFEVIPNLESIQKVEAYDFDNDGKDEIFVKGIETVTFNQKVIIYEIDPINGFQDITASYPSFASSNINYDIVDFDGDGDLDIFLPTPTGVDYFENVVSNTLNVQTQDITLSLDINGRASITPQDIDNGSSAVCGVSLSLDITDFDCTDVGPPVQVTLTATDAIGSTSSATAVVTVIDDTAPEISLNGNLTETVNQGTVYSDRGATALDNCDGTVSLVVSGDTVDTAVFGTYTITYTATDSSGNTSSVDRVVTVADIVLPEIIAASITSDNGNSAFAKAGDLITLTFTTSEEVLQPDVTIAMINAAVSATANPNEWVATTFVPNRNSVSMAVLPDGMLPFEINVEDLNGNLILASHTITTDVSEVVLDRTSPIVDSQNVSISLDTSGNGVFDINNVINSITDANNYSTSSDVPLIECSILGVNAYTLTATDEAGNTGQDLFILTVEDNLSPIMTLNGPASIIIDRGTSYTEAGVTIVDNCDTTLTAVIAGDTVDTLISNTYVVTYNVSDSSGNAATELTRTVIVKNPDFIYESGGWTPNDPSNISNPAGFNDNVIIRENVTVSGDFRANDLTIETGATLTLVAGVTVGIDNNLNGGEINATTATLLAYGQTFSNTWNVNNVSIGTIELANSNLNLTGTYRINESLYNDDTASTSILNVVGANVTLVSTAAQTALIDGSLLDVIGELTVEKFFNDRRAYRFISSPVTTTTTIFNNWQEGGLNLGDSDYDSGYGTHISGTGGAANGFDVTGTNNTSMFGWDNVNQNWTAQTSTSGVTDLLVAGQFSRLMVRGDREIDLTTNDSSSATILRTAGSLLNSSYTLPQLATNAGDFMIVGNPYQSKLQLSSYMQDLFDGSSYTINAVQPNFYFVWDPLANTRGAYRTYGRQINATIGPNVPNSNYDEAGVLQPGQAAFFIASGISGSTFILERSSNAITPPPVSISNVPEGQLAINLYESTQFNQGLGSLDGLLVRFENGARNTVDGNDAVKFDNLDENLGRAHLIGTTLSIERRDLPQHGEVLPLAINNLRHTNYTIQVQPVGFVLKQAILKDNFNNTLTPLDNNQVTIYSYTVDAANASSIAADRFEIVFEDVTLGIGEGNLLSQAISIYPNPVLGSEFYIDFGNITGNKKVTIYNALGQKINTYNTEESSVYELKSDALAPGMYVIEIEKDDQKFTEKLIVK